MDESMGDEKVAGGGHGAEAASVAPAMGHFHPFGRCGHRFRPRSHTGGNPEFSAGAAILMALMLAAIGLQRAARPDHRHKTAAEAVRSAFFEHAIEGTFPHPPSMGGIWTPIRRWRAFTVMPIPRS